MHWSADYIGLPWQVGGLTRDGIACWGLARLVYAECNSGSPCRTTPLPCRRSRSVLRLRRSSPKRPSTTGPWLNVGAADAAEFDILVFRRAGLAHHVGIAIGAGRMLHIDTGQDSCLVDYTTGRWASRLVGAYAHKARILDAVMAA